MVVAVLAYLHFYGLPSPCKRAILDELNRRGVAFSIDSLHFDLRRGVVARGIEYKPKAEDDGKIHMGELSLGLSLPDLLRKRIKLDRLDVDGSDIKIFSTGQQEPILIHHVEGVIGFEKSVLHLESVVGDLEGLSLQLDGKLDLAKKEQGAPVKSDPPRIASLLQSYLAKLGTVKKGEPIQIQLNVVGKMAEPETLSATASIYGRALAYEGWHADKISGRFAFSGGILNLSVLTVEAGPGKLSVYGSWDIKKGPVQFEIYSNLNPHALVSSQLESAPGAWKDLRFGAAPEIWVKGSMDVSRPQPWESIVAEASFSIRDSSWRKKALRELRGTAHMEAGKLRVPQLTLVRDFGRMTGDFEYEFATQAVNFDLESTVDVAEVMRLLYPSDKNWFQSVEHAMPPALKMAGRWLTRDPNGLQAEGTMDWKEWSAAGVGISSTSAHVIIKGRRFQFEGLKLERPEGRIEGKFTLDFGSSMAEIDATTSIGFRELTLLVGPKTEELFRPYKFLTPPKIKLKGVLDFGKDQQNDLTANIECARFSVWRLSAANVTAQIRSHRKCLEIANYSSDFYQGKLTGDAVFDFSTPDQDWSFHCNIEKGDFDRFTHDLWNYDQVEGMLTASAQMSGTMKTSKTLKGYGEAKIDDGVLWRIPLFGELSKFIPILGVQKATKGLATFTVSDEKVHVGDMKISAGIMSLTAKGDYDFDQSLDFIVQGHFLRAFGLGYILDPFTKAFEYHLGGKLSARKWKPRFLPKELLLDFNKDEPQPKKDSSK